MLGILERWNAKSKWAEAVRVCMHVGRHLYVYICVCVCMFVCEWLRWK